jgi:hypothetical protein
VNWDKRISCQLSRLVQSKIKSFDHEYKFGDDVVRVVKVFTLLGVHIDCTLSFVTNVEESCKKVRGGGALFSLKSKFFLLYETRLQFFKTFISPHFDYCISLAIYYATELRMSLVKLHNFCLRKLRLSRVDKFEHIRDIGFQFVFKKASFSINKFKKKNLQ